MSSTSTPARTRVYRSHHIDSTLWDGFVARPGDIIISTPAKTGTTWMQRIVSLLVFQTPRPTDTLNQLSPWIDAAFIAKVIDTRAVAEAQRHRRFLKSHLPLDALPWFPDARYVVVGRDGRDVFMSLWNHYRSYTPEAYALFDSVEASAHDPCPRCPDDVHEFWRWWIGRGAFPWEQDGYPFGSYFHHLRSFWEFRRLPNLLLVHYNDLKRDLGGEMRRIAAFLDIAVPEATWPTLVDTAGFEAMKQDGEMLLPELALIFQGGSQTFLNQGTNERWRDVLTAEELAQYEAVVTRTLTPDLARWVERGREGGEPRDG
ncbi:MAG: sulfotransferase domain-containing protein [Deltaproteobacteria bacterium]|nr:sulfotransferase domain-containing protein [Deltaproteobacteria bacterium]